MNALAAFFERNIITVYFIYGLAFFSMGLAVWLESRRASEFRIARAMGFLAGFGITHGFHEWVAMFRRIDGLVEAGSRAAIYLSMLDLGLLTLSFVVLIIFGARLIHSDDDSRAFPLVLGTILLIVWGGSVFTMQQLFAPCLTDCLTGIDVITRYMLAVPGTALAAWAMVLEQRAFRARGMYGFGRDLLWAALAMFLYGVVGQAFTQRSFLFPSTIINADLFLELFGIPVQLFRAFAAGIITIFVIRALRAFELESQQRLATANEARLAAQREALETQRRAQAETEQLNRELRFAVQDLSTLFELSRTLGSTLDRDALLEQAIAKIADSVPRIDAGFILLRDKADGQLQVMAKSGCPPEDTTASIDESLVRRAHKLGEYVAQTDGLAYCVNGQIVSLDDLEIPERHLRREPREPGPRRYILGAPLKTQGRVAGSLVLCTSPDTPPLTRRDISLTRTIARQLSIAIENANLYREVQEREALRGELLRQIVSAQEKERRRIARELHDETGQALTALGLGLAAAAESMASDPSRAAQQLAELRALSAQAIEELHELVADLRPSILDDLGLVPALRRQIEDFESRTEVQVEFHVEGRRRRMRPEIETVLFRIAQEALTNIAKHASAGAATVGLAYADGSVQLTVRDDGRGFDPEEVLGGDSERRRAWGLLGIQERVALVGGTCQISSQPGTGTTIHVDIPLSQEGDS